MTGRGPNTRDAVAALVEASAGSGYLGPILAFACFMGVMRQLPGHLDLADVAASESVAEFATRRIETVAAVHGRTLLTPVHIAAPGVAYVVLDSGDAEHDTFVTLVRRPDIHDVIPEFDHWRVLAVGDPVPPNEIALA